MANNYKVIDATNTSIDMRSTDDGGVQVPHYLVDLASVVKNGAGTAGNTATALNATYSLKSGVTVRCKANSPEEIYVGDSVVTVLNGYPLHPGNSIFVSVSDLANCYVISTGGTGTFAFLGS